ncbi:MAG: sulfatase-like hydrolase/transferase, partial [Methylococcales bacterium]|nr:sulfatase-like hydrolase/transferase [Methylococcales bacterium]
GFMWSQLMTSVGYDTYFTGKWHVKADAPSSFKTTRHIRGGMPKQTLVRYNRSFAKDEDSWSPYDKKFGGFWAGGKHWSEVVADDAEDFLEMAKGNSDPFFMYIAFNAAHDPRQAPKEFVDKYPLDRIELPKNFLPEYPYKEKIDCGKNLRDERLAPFPRTEYSVKVNRQEYYALITHMDVQIGRILDALKESGKEDNTYIFFTADHGLSVGHHGLIGKQNLFDHSMRVPMMVVGPGVAAGVKNESPVYLQDIMATSLELAAVEKPKHVQFQSLKPVWEGKSNGYESVYGAYLKSQRCVIKDGYKLLLYPKVPMVQLFNTKSDPLEVTDLYAKEKKRAKELFAHFLKLQKQTGDTLDLKSVFPDLQ